MGIYDRDYYRGDSDRMFASLGRWGATVWLILITCGVFLLQILTRDAAPPGLTIWGVYFYDAILHGEVWRFFTPMFLTSFDGLLSLALSMFVLYGFGRTLEEKYGSRGFTLFYLLAGITGYVGLFLFQAAGLPRGMPMLGSGGAVTAVLVLYALHYPRQQVMLFFVIPMPIWGVAVLFVGLGMLGALGGPHGAVSVLTCLLGAAFAFAVYRMGARKPAYEWSQTSATRPRLRVVPMDDDTPPRRVEEPEDSEVDESRLSPTEEALESKLDRVLEKVSRHGQGSLSGDEREILFRASEVYKKRRK